MVTICTPTRESLLAGFVYDLVLLIKKNPDSIFATATGTYLSNLRTKLARTALQNGASHILFIDSDMRFPDSTIDRLVKADKDIIGANCVSRTQGTTTARIDEQFVQSKGKTGLEQVDFLGMGVTLIKAEVFKKLDEPWFAMPWNMAEKEHVGEDIYFCKMARDAGFEVWVDHDLSKEVKHTGQKEWGIE